MQFQSADGPIFGRPDPAPTHDLTVPALPGPGDLPRFALVTFRFAERPLIFDYLGGLARAIHRRRGDEALQLRPERVRFRDEVRECVAVHALDPVGQRERLIGHAWIGGRDWRVLQAALADVTPLQAVRS